MNRQQRTTFLRQRLQPDQPQLLSDMLWLLSAKDTNLLQFQIYGSFEGAVLEGLPDFQVSGSSAVPVNVNFLFPPAPGLYGVLTVLFDQVLPEYFTVTLSQRSRCLRNAFGGLLAPGKAGWPVTPPPSPDFSPSIVSYTGHDLVMYLPTFAFPILYNNTLVFSVNAGTDQGVAHDLQGQNLTIKRLGSAWQAGDQIELAAPSDLCVNATRGRLAAFNLFLT